jgi:hypothetical protein
LVGDPLITRAWQRFLPLTRKEKLDSHAGSVKSCWSYSFWFPSSLALIQTVRILPENLISIEQARTHTVTFRHTPHFTNGITAELKSLYHLARENLRVLANVIGLGEPDLELEDKPFSIVTLIDGEGFDPDQALQPDGPLHLVLDTLCHLPRRPSRKPRAKLEDAGIDVRLETENEVVYGSRRGRVVWMPRHFSDQSSSENPKALSNYHYNLSLATLQTRVITSIAEEFRQYMKRSTDLSEKGRLAAKMARRLYHGSETYHTGSVARQIMDELKHVNKLRKYFRLPSIGEEDQ